jgi:hypothetical protein
MPRCLCGVARSTSSVARSRMCEARWLRVSTQLLRAATPRPRGPCGGCSSPARAGSSKTGCPPGWPSRRRCSMAALGPPPVRRSSRPSACRGRSCASRGGSASTTARSTPCRRVCSTNRPPAAPGDSLTAAGCRREAALSRRDSPAELWSAVAAEVAQVPLVCAVAVSRIGWSLSSPFRRTSNGSCGRTSPAASSASDLAGHAVRRAGRVLSWPSRARAGVSVRLAMAAGWHRQLRISSTASFPRCPCGSG